MGRSRLKFSQEEKTAYHEAGHAVFFLARGISIEFVTIVPIEKTRGYVSRKVDAEGNCEVEEDERRYCENELRTLLFGVLAERQLTGKLMWGSAGVVDGNRCIVDSDWDKVELLCRSGSPEAPEEFLAWIWRECDDIIRRPEFWHPIRAVATKLLETKTLSGRECKRIYNQALKDKDGIEEVKIEYRKYREKKQKHQFKQTPMFKRIARNIQAASDKELQQAISNLSEKHFQRLDSAMKSAKPDGSRK